MKSQILHYEQSVTKIISLIQITTTLQMKSQILHYEQSVPKIISLIQITTILGITLVLSSHYFSFHLFLGEASSTVSMLLNISS